MLSFQLCKTKKEEKKVYENSTDQEAQPAPLSISSRYQPHPQILKINSLFK
jgi:hypothetical protein